MKIIWVNKADSFAAADRFDRQYYNSMTAAQRVETVQFLREAHFGASGVVPDENGKRLRRVLSVVEQA